MMILMMRYMTLLNIGILPGQRFSYYQETRKNSNSFKIGWKTKFLCLCNGCLKLQVLNSKIKLFHVWRFLEQWEFILFVILIRPKSVFKSNEIVAFSVTWYESYWYVELLIHFKPLLKSWGTFVWVKYSQL